MQAQTQTQFRFRFLDSESDAEPLTTSLSRFSLSTVEEDDALLRGRVAENQPELAAQQWNQDFLQNVRLRTDQGSPHYRFARLIFKFSIFFLVRILLN